MAVMRNRFYFSSSEKWAPAPGTWWTAHSAMDAIAKVKLIEKKLPEFPIEVVVVTAERDMYGDSYVKVLKDLEHRGKNYPIFIAKKRNNPEIVAEMREIIARNGWTELPTDRTTPVYLQESTLLGRGPFY